MLMHLISMSTHPSTSSNTVYNDPASLPDDFEVLKRMIRELLQALKEAQQEREGLQQRLDQLLRRLYGPKSERLDPNQAWLFPEMETAEATPEPVSQTAAETDTPLSPKRKGHGRKGLPEKLPRHRVEHTLPEAERVCSCCGDVCTPFGEDVSEQLDYQPARLFVWQHVRVKYSCQKCHDGVFTAPPPVSIIDKGLPGVGLLAGITTCKYTDHLPLHRLERILLRSGVELARSTMCSWMAEVAKRVRPVVDVMADLIRESRMIHTDATKMPYLNGEVRRKTVSGQMWIYWGDRDHPFAVFDFCKDHTAAGIDAFLKEKNYKGFLSADAHNLYDHLFLDETILEVGCWAHCRRNFHDAKGSDPTRAHLALARIGQLYQVEREAQKIIDERRLKGVDADLLRLQMRQEKSVAIMTSLRQWFVEEQPKVLPKSPIGKAIAYALRHGIALSRYLEDGSLVIDNNVAERALRHIAIGRKNWLFAGNQAAGHTAATLFSLTSSCQRNNIDAFAYLRDLLNWLAHNPNPSKDQIRDWLPDRWKPPPDPNE